MLPKWRRAAVAVSGSFQPLSHGQSGFEPGTLTFDHIGKLLSIKNPAGNTIALSYYPQGAMEYPALGGITDTNNAFWDVDRAYIGEERIADITHPNNQHTVFGYLNTYDDYLTKVTEADGAINKYAYDTSHRVKSITTPDGNVTLITYSGTSSKVASIIRTNNPAHTTGPTTTFTYSSPTTPCQSTNFDYAKTVVQRPDSTSTTYCANDHAQITYDTDNPATATPSGEWYDLRGGYVKGTGTHSVTLSGADAGAGVKKLALERIGGGEVASSTLPCDPRNALSPTACPHSATRAVTFDAAGLPEDADTFRQATTDYAGNVKRSADWIVKVDRTPPEDPSAFLGDFDEETGEGDVDWLAQDPILADGTPGSGIVTYEYRYSRPGQQLSVVHTSSEPGFRFPSAVVGELVHVEVTAGDAVGNRSATVAADIAIGSAGDCQVDPDAVDSIDASLHVADSGQPVDAFTFDDPKTPAQVRAALPAGTQVVSMLERQPGTDVDTQTSAIALIPRTISRTTCFRREPRPMPRIAESSISNWRASANDVRS